MKIVKAYGGNGGNFTVAVPALTGSQMAVFIINVWGGPYTGFPPSGSNRSYGGSVNMSGSNLDGNLTIYAMNAAWTTSTYGGTVGTAVAPPVFITTSTGNQNITVSAATIQNYESINWNGILCIYNPPF